MGQISFNGQKPKYCNLTAIQNGGSKANTVPDDGEVWLVDSSNTKSDNGAGEYDCYIVGDGETACSLLPIHGFAPSEKDYDASVFSGFGRKYLRKNIVNVSGTDKNVLTSAMLSSANTVYHIQYDYDLNGQSITLPAGITLKFEGGSIKNGTLVSDDLKIINEQDLCIFKNIIFEGACTRNPVKVAWFVSSYPKNTNDFTVDNTSEINMALTCGSRLVLFPSDRHLHISSTLVVESSVDLDIDRKISEANHAYRVKGNDIPCVFTNEVVTMLQYNFRATNNKSTLFIGAINFINYKTFSDLSDKDVPIVNIISKYSDMWEVNIHCNIKVADAYVTSKYFHNYTGITIVADGHYIALVRIYGEINGLYKAFNFDILNGTWFTDVQIFSDTRAVIGCTSKVSPMYIYGSHQPFFELPLGTQTAYFTSSEDIICYGMIWDLNHTSGDYQSARYGVCSTKKGRVYSRNYGAVGNTSKFNVNYPEIRFEPWGATDNIYGSCFNLLDCLLIQANYIRTNLIKSVSYTLDDIDLLSNSSGDTYTLYNYHNLFNSFKMSASAYNSSMSLSSAARVSFSSASTHTLNFTCIIKGAYKYEDIRLLYKLGRSDVSGTLLIQELNNETDQTVVDTLLDTTMPIDSYYADMVGITPSFSSPEGSSKTLKITLTLSYPSITTVNLPMLAIPIRQVLNTQLTNVKSKRPVFGNEKSINMGLLFYDQTYYRPCWYDSNNSKWRDAQGYTIGKSFGDTNNRPTLTTDGDKGFRYYDTSLNKSIYWSGSKWVDEKGYTVAVRKGTTSQRPTSTLTSDDAGFEYFDTTLGKPIWWTGSAWVDASGNNPDANNNSEE